MGGQQRNNRFYQISAHQRKELNSPHRLQASGRPLNSSVASTKRPAFCHLYLLKINFSCFFFASSKKYINFAPSIHTKTVKTLHFDDDHLHKQLLFCWHNVLCILLSISVISRRRIVSVVFFVYYYRFCSQRSVAKNPIERSDEALVITYNLSLIVRSLTHHLSLIVHNYKSQLPPISIGTSQEPHRNFIGTSPRDQHRISKG